MDKSQALEALAALAHQTRLDVFRLLVQAGPAGLPAGEIAEALEVRQNTMSSHLGILTRAGMITNEREGRVIQYSATTKACASCCCICSRIAAAAIPRSAHRSSPQWHAPVE